jgi:HAD superfamily hydrolase (TIGR01493 family)
MGDMPVIFDIGGVLIDWDPRHLYRKLLPDEPAVERFLAEVCTAAWNAEQDRGRSWAEAVAALTARFPGDAALISSYDERWGEMVAGAFDDSVAVLRELREAGVPLFALTNFSVEKFRQTRARFGFLDWFDGIVVSGEERLVKPDPRIYRLLLGRYGLRPAATVYVDDLPANVEAARSVGMTGLHFTGAARLRSELASLGLLNGGSEQIGCAKVPDTRNHGERN